MISRASDRPRHHSATTTAGTVDALEQAIYDRRPELHALVHHSDRGTQYLWMRYTDRLADAGIARRSAAAAMPMTTRSPNR